MFNTGDKVMVSNIRIGTIVECKTTYTDLITYKVSFGKESLWFTKDDLKLYDEAINKKYKDEIEKKTCTDLDYILGLICNDIIDTVCKKNADYGNSFENTVKEYGNVAYLLRIEDKISRLKSLTIKNKSIEVKDESIEDTLKDIIGYTLLMLKYNKGE